MSGGRSTECRDEKSLNTTSKEPNIRVIVLFFFNHSKIKLSEVFMMKIMIRKITHLGHIRM